MEAIFGLHINFMRIKNVFRTICCLISICCSLSVHAYRVEPMVSEMEPFGKKAQMVMRVDNTTTQPLTVELLPFSMVMDEYGNETIEPADADLLVVPVTAVIEPGRSQSVMVRYLGEPAIDKSKSYRVSVKQVQVDRASSEQANVGVLLQFNTLINIKPKNTNPHLNVTNIEAQGEAWHIEVTNSGNSYGRINKTNWKVSDGVQSVSLKGSEIGKLIDGTLVQPQKKRIFTMKPLEGFDLSSLSIEVDSRE